MIRQFVLRFTAQFVAVTTKPIQTTVRQTLKEF
jgi:hypothetical protein